MSPPIITVPRQLLRMVEIDWQIDPRGQGSPLLNNGNSQTVFNKFPRWIGSPKLVLRGDAILQWRALRAAAMGRASVYRVPMIDPLGFAYRAAGISDQTIMQGLPFSTGMRFSTGQGFESDPFVVCKSGANAGASEILIDEASLGVPVKVGSYLSYQDWPFIVVSRTQEEALMRLSVAMPLRAKIPEGALISCMATGLFEAVEELMGNPAYGNSLTSRPTLKFQEWLNR